MLIKCERMAAASQSTLPQSECDSLAGVLDAALVLRLLRPDRLGRHGRVRLIHCRHALQQPLMPRLHRHLHLPPLAPH